MSRPSEQKFYAPDPGSRYIGHVAFDGTQPAGGGLASQISWMTVAELIAKEDPRCDVVGLSIGEDGLVVWKKFKP